jgi:hypothetical protein
LIAEADLIIGASFNDDSCGPQAVHSGDDGSSLAVSERTMAGGTNNARIEGFRFNAFDSELRFSSALAQLSGVNGSDVKGDDHALDD